MIKCNHDKLIIYYILLLIAHIGLIWWLPYIPTQDGPSHVYNLVILHDLLNGGSEWGDVFSYRLRAVPNLGFIFLGYPLLKVFHPLVVERIFLSLYVALMGASVPFFLRTFNKNAFPTAYFVFPVIFNYNLLMGFYSYIVAVPLFLLALSFAWRIRDRSSICKFICLNLLALAVFYIHLIPCVFFLLSLIVITTVDSATYKEKIINVSKLLLIIAPSIFNLVYYLRLGRNSFVPDFSYLLSTSRFARLLTELFYFSCVNFFPWQIFPASLVMVLVVVFGYHFARDLYKRKMRGEDVIPSEKTLIYLSLVLIVIYLSAPFSIGDGRYFNERLPWVILIISLPLLSIPKTIAFRRIASVAIIGVVSVFFAVNVVVLRQQSNTVGKFLSGLNVKLPKRAFVMTYKTKEPKKTTVDILLHASSYYGILKGSVDVGNYEVNTDLFPVRFNKSFRAIPPERQISFKPETINLANYPSIQYLLGWEMDNKERQEVGRFFHVIWEEDQFSIWQRGV
jgi:hypothetical protein